MRHVLSIEDDPLNQSLIRDIFRYDNVIGELVCVDSAEEGLRILPSLDLLVVLMDLMLPGISGIEATRIIKSDQATKDIPVWMISACKERSIIDEAIAAGCDHYYAKPFKAKQLAEQLRLLWEDRETGRSRSVG